MLLFNFHRFSLIFFLIFFCSCFVSAVCAASPPTYLSSSAVDLSPLPIERHSIASQRLCTNFILLSLHCAPTSTVVVPNRSGCARECVSHRRVCLNVAAAYHCSLLPFSPRVHHLCSQSPSPNWYHYRHRTATTTRSLFLALSFLFSLVVAVVSTASTERQYNSQLFPTTTTTTIIIISSSTITNFSFCAYSPGSAHHCTVLHLPAHTYRLLSAK